MSEAFAEEKYQQWCVAHRLDPSDTESMVAYEDEAASSSSEEVYEEWTAYRGLGLKPDPSFY